MMLNFIISYWKWIQIFPWFVFSVKVVEDLISKHISTMENLEKAVHADSIPEYFPSAQAYHANSVVSMIKLQSLPLIHLVKNDASALQLESAVLLFLEGSSCYDWKLRLDYLQSVADVICANKSFIQCHEDVYARLKSFMQSFGTMFSSHLMVNLRNEFKGLESTRFG